MASTATISHNKAAQSERGEVADAGEIPNRSSPYSRFSSPSGAVPLAAEDTAKDFAPKAAITKQLRDRNPETRVAAARKLANIRSSMPPRSSCCKAWKAASRTCRRSLPGHARHVQYRPGSLRLLHGESLKGIRRKPLPFKTAATVAVLFASNIPEVSRKAEPLLNQVAESEGGPLLLVILVDQLALVDDDPSFQLLLKLRDLPLFQKFGPRRALAQALIKIRRPAAVSELVKILQRVQGEVRVEITQYLASISGQRFEIADEWADWWKKTEPTFEFPPVKLDPLAPTVAAGTATYYGLPLYGSKIVFIIDASVSMRGPRIEAAKRELAKAITELPSGAEFNVLAFSLGVMPWQSQLVPSAKQNKEEAKRFVLGLPLASRTASFDALEAALNYDAEAIYFLTDGQPNDGKVTQPAEIVAIISKVNRVRRVTINTIGIGVGPDAGPFSAFLKALAGENFGTFRRVDE